MGVFSEFEWNADWTPMVKLAFHIAQIVLAFVVFVLEIILFKSPKAEINGNNGWPFGLCFLSIPAWIFLVLTPRFKRSQKLAQPHAMIVIDFAFAVCWLSAFASQAAYNTANDCGKGCSVSKAIVGIAFFCFLFWCVTTFISFYTLNYYSFNGKLPGYDKVTEGRPHDIDPDKAAFSMAPQDEEAYAPVGMDEHDDHEHDHISTPYNADSFGANSSRPGRFDAETEYRSHHPAASESSSHYDGASSIGGGGGVDPYRAHSTSPHNDPYSSVYGGASSVGSEGPHLYAPPAADEYDEAGPAQFPAANYDRTLR